MRTLLVAAAVTFGVAAGCSSSKPAGSTVRVAAASDLSRAFEELDKAFTAKTGITPVVDFGSSGMLEKQIEQGAPYGLFLAANRPYVDQVVAAGKCDAATVQLYAHGHVVAWTRTGPAPATLADLANPRWKRIAVANPDHAPYGKAAKQALVKAGLWDSLEDRMVLADSVQAAMTYAREGSADIALVSMSLVAVDTAGAFLPIDSALHEPLEQTLVVCGTGPEAAAGRQLAAYLMSGEGRELMARYGFALTSTTAAAKP